MPDEFISWTPLSIRRGTARRFDFQFNFLRSRSLDYPGRPVSFQALFNVPATFLTRPFPSVRNTVLQKCLHTFAAPPLVEPQLYICMCIYKIYIHMIHLYCTITVLCYATLCYAIQGDSGSYSHTLPACSLYREQSKVTKQILRIRCS